MLNIGTEVRLKKSSVKDHQIAKIKGFLDDVPGGVFLDRDLAGGRYWHVKELEIVQAGEKQLEEVKEQFAVLAGLRYYCDHKTVLNAPSEEAYKKAIRVLGEFLGIK